VVKVLLLAAGGAAGTLARYGLTQFAARFFPGSFPKGTLLVNLAGCFLIGIFSGMDTRGAFSLETKLFLTAGFCGGFTTFSALILESADLASKGQSVAAFLNILISVAAGFLLFFLGLQIVKGNS
jgi:CrcB protein